MGFCRLRDSASSHIDDKERPVLQIFTNQRGAAGIIGLLYSGTGVFAV